MAPPLSFSREPTPESGSEFLKGAVLAAGKANGAGKVGE